MSIKRFKELSISEQGRIYALCLGNPMIIAEYMRNNGSADNVYDIETVITGKSESEISEFERLRLMRIDSVIKNQFGTGNSSYDLKIAEKLHPDYKAKKESGDRVLVIMGHMDRVAKMCGREKQELLATLEIPPDVEEVNGK